MSYPNQLVFTQFHPVAYMVKLNIEMSMASLIARLAGIRSTQVFNSRSFPHGHHSHLAMDSANRPRYQESPQQGGIELGQPSDEDLRKIQSGGPGIHRRLEVEVRVDSPQSRLWNEGRSNNNAGRRRSGSSDDEVSLTQKVDSRLP